MNAGFEQSAQEIQELQKISRRESELLQKLIQKKFKGKIDYYPSSLFFFFFFLFLLL